MAFSLRMAIPARFERATYCLEGSCSIQLSYGTTTEEIIQPETSYCQDIFIKVSIPCPARIIRSANSVRVSSSRCMTNPG